MRLIRMDTLFTQCKYTIKLREYSRDAVKETSSDGQAALVSTNLKSSKGETEAHYLFTANSSTFPNVPTKCEDESNSYLTCNIRDLQYISEHE